MTLKKLWFRLSLIWKYGIVVRKPIYDWRVLRNVLKVRLLGRQVLRGVDFSIDYRCNLKCDHCFAERLKRHGVRQMSLDDYKRVVDEAMRLGACTFSIQGGEVFLNRDYERILEMCRPGINRINISTNGTMINEARVKSLKKLGVDCLNISLDSGIAEEHDQFRGAAGTYDKVMRTIELASAHGINVSINTTLSHQSLRSPGLLKLLGFAQERKIMVNTLFAAPSGNWEGNRDVMLTEEDVDYFKDLRAKYPVITRDLDNNYQEPGCGAVKEMFYISPYGDVLGCPFVHISLGNVLEEPLAVVRQRSLQGGPWAHYNKKCWASEEPAFIRRYLARIEGETELPVRDDGFWQADSPV
ncbi:MAG: radical SAM protein [Chloroflexi bacterium]|nr:radical SAM protein [Chloroflexota bacterium]